MLRKAWDARKEWTPYAAAVFVLHVFGLAGLAYAARVDAAIGSIGLLAYTLGMRHAFDADHIAAIDNTVRKLLEQKRNPLGVGFFFSLGHSSVVLLMVLAIAFSVQWIQNRMPHLQEAGSLIGMTVSGAFLVVIGFINLIVLVNLLQIFRAMRGDRYDNDKLERLLESRGFFYRMLRPMFRFISRSWHVYPLGFLFGLGFDTATEIGLLAISAVAAKSSVPVVGILSLPVLFAAGMSLMDTADGMFMTKAYRWAFTTPLRKLYYNVTVTSISVAAALVIGAVELIQVIGDRLGLRTPLFRWFAGLDFGDLGFVLVFLFVFAWLVSVAIWKLLKVEQRFGA